MHLTEKCMSTQGNSAKRGQSNRLAGILDKTQKQANKEY